MNILPHKSWHVYNAKNRERVERDEAAALDKQQEHLERAENANREHRLSLLRNRAAARGAGESVDAPIQQRMPYEVPASSPPRSDDVQERQQSTMSNGILAREKHTKWPTRDQQDGTLIRDTRHATAKMAESPLHSTPGASKAQRHRSKESEGTLGQLVRGGAPWYARHANTDTHAHTARSRKRAIIAPQLELEDPVSAINKYQKRRRTDERAWRSHESEHPYMSAPPNSRQTAPATTKSLQELRQERQERERRESARARMLLGEQPHSLESGQQYHSQYHPEMTRDAHASQSVAHNLQKRSSYPHSRKSHSQPR